MRRNSWWVWIGVAAVLVAGAWWLASQASNDGLSWSSLGLIGMLMAAASSPADPNRLVAVDDQGWVYASRDGGATWGSN